MDRTRESEFNKFKKKNERNAVNYLKGKFTALSDASIMNIIQDSYVVLYQSIKENKISELYYPYFLKTCVNFSLKAVAKQSAHVILGINDDKDIVQKKSVSLDKVNEVLRQQAEEEEALKEKKELVHRTFDKMATRCKELLWSFYAEELSWSTIAGLYGLKNADSAKTAASRCRQTFKEKYTQIRSIYG